MTKKEEKNTGEMKKDEKPNPLKWKPNNGMVTPYAKLPICTGTNGPEGTNCRKDICNGTNGPMDGEVGTPCKRLEPKKIPHANTNPTAGQPF